MTIHGPPTGVPPTASLSPLSETKYTGPHCFLDEAGAPIVPVYLYPRCWRSTPGHLYETPAATTQRLRPRPASHHSPEVDPEATTESRWVPPAVLSLGQSCYYPVDPGLHGFGPPPVGATLPRPCPSSQKRTCAMCVPACGPQHPSPNSYSSACSNSSPFSTTLLSKFLTMPFRWRSAPRQGHTHLVSLGRDLLLPRPPQH